MSLDLPRLILYDPRGWGVSDRYPPGDAATTEEHVADMLAVLDALNISSAAVMVSAETQRPGSPRGRDRAEPRVIPRLVPRVARLLATEDLPWETSQERARSVIASIRRSTAWDEWARQFVREALPSHADDEQAIAWFATMQRLTEGPGSAIAHLETATRHDLRDALSSIDVRTLILHRTELAHTTSYRIETSRYMAERIPDATMVEVPGSDVYPWGGDWEPVAAEIQRFLTGTVEEPAPEIAVATVLFTDIVNSTAQAAMLGDQRWSELRERHDRLIRSELRKNRGREVDTAGDGFLATFAAPSNAVRCATAAVAGVRELGLEIRAGLHTGEVELDGDAVRGIAVHIGARVSSLAGPNEVLISQTVRDMLAGSGATFEDAGEHELKGVPDRWRLYRVRE